MKNFFGPEPLIVKMKRGSGFEYITPNTGTDLLTELKSIGITAGLQNQGEKIFRQKIEAMRASSPLLNLACQTEHIAMFYLSSYVSPEGCSIDILTAMENQTPLDKVSEITSHLLPQVALILKNYAAYEEISSLKKQLEQEKVSLIGEISTAGSYQEIIGTSAVLQNVLYKVRQVAPLDATVLILGETGTGKELIARAIHNTSDRKGKALISINCASLPSQLIDSELFGHDSEDPFHFYPAPLRGRK